MRNIIKHILKECFLMMIGGVTYCMIEILWRGYTHWSMFFVSAICFGIIGVLNETYKFETPLLFQMLESAIIVTILEFISGYVINIKLGMNVWDYSTMFGNIKGQICPLYSFLWFLLSAIAIIFDDYLRYWLFNEKKPHYEIL